MGLLDLQALGGWSIGAVISALAVARRGLYGRSHTLSTAIVTITCSMYTHVCVCGVDPLTIRIALARVTSGVS